MLHVYRNVLDEVKRFSINNLEPFDEYEMFDLKCLHYVLAIGTEDKEFAEKFHLRLLIHTVNEKTFFCNFCRISTDMLKMPQNLTPGRRKNIFRR